MTTAMDFCGKAAEKAHGEYLQDCGVFKDEGVEAWCYSGALAHWTNNPFMAERAWLLEHFVPLLPICDSSDDECLYAAGVETNRELQCTLRGKGHVIAQTEGLFRHLNPLWLERGICERGKGYWFTASQLCRVWK